MTRNHDSILVTLLIPQSCRFVTTVPEIPSCPCPTKHVPDRQAKLAIYMYHGPGTFHVKPTGSLPGLCRHTTYKLHRPCIEGSRAKPHP